LDVVSQVYLTSEDWKVGATRGPLPEGPHRSLVLHEDEGPSLRRASCEHRGGRRRWHGTVTQSDPPGSTVAVRRAPRGPSHDRQALCPSGPSWSTVRGQLEPQPEEVFGRQCRGLGPLSSLRTHSRTALVEDLVEVQDADSCSESRMLSSPSECIPSCTWEGAESWSGTRRPRFPRRRPRAGLPAAGALLVAQPVEDEHVEVARSASVASGRIRAVMSGRRRRCTRCSGQEVVWSSTTLVAIWHRAMKRPGSGFQPSGRGGCVFCHAGTELTRRH